jgi:two-component system NtrC family response regulator
MSARVGVCCAPAPRIRPIVGTSTVLRGIVALAERFAPTRVPVLLVGETGTGKELLAQHIHRVSGRRGELVDIDCGALPREMIESLLFGHRRGAFTGAHDDTIGLVARAAGGTLYLDELSSLPVEGQAKLLRVLETGEILRLGDTVKQRVDFRVIAAVQDGIAGLIAKGLFRRDLYHRIAGIILRLPPLRERRDDIAPLAAHFAGEHGRTITTAAAAMLREHDWPGNVRELRAVIQRAAVLATEAALGPVEIAQAMDGCGAETGEGQMKRAPDSAERLALLRLCEEHDGPARAIAQAAGLSRATLFRRLKALGITLRTVSKSRGSQRVSETGETLPAAR